MLSRCASNRPKFAFSSPKTAISIDRKGLSGPALKAFFRISELWKFSNEDQMTLLGVTTPSTFFKWKRDAYSAKLTKDTMERISYLLGIYKALQILLPRPEADNSSIKKPNTATPFGGSRLWTGCSSQSRICTWSGNISTHSAAVGLEFNGHVCRDDPGQQSRLETVLPDHPKPVPANPPL